MVVDSGPDHVADPVVLRMVQPAERAQAELFAEVLRNEIATMTVKIAKAEADWRRRCQEKGYVEPPCRIAVVLERIEEATHMLEAIDARFLGVR
jgi:hypothetical protein